MKKKFGKPLVILLAFCMILACVPVYAADPVPPGAVTITNQNEWETWWNTPNHNNNVIIKATDNIVINQEIPSGVEITIESGSVRVGGGNLKGSLFVTGGALTNEGAIDTAESVKITGGTFTNQGTVTGTLPVEINGGTFVNRGGSVESLKLTSGALKCEHGTIDDITMTGGTLEYESVVIGGITMTGGKVTNTTTNSVILIINGEEETLGGGLRLMRLLIS